MEFTAKTLRDRIYVVTSYFNWDGYNRKLANFRAFANRLHEQQIPLFAIECALGDRPFELGESAALRARTQSRLWQKEKLLNFAIRRLPESCEYVVWMDADLIFPDNGWPSRVQHALADADVVQTFSTVIRLAEDNNLESLSTRVDKGIIASLKHKNEHILSSRGHPGFAWAARRQFLLDWPLYDAAIVGGADKMMLCAWSDIADCPVTRSMTSPRSFKHFLDWAKGGRCRVSYAPGVVYHLWHGEQKNRHYQQRYRILQDFDFCPVDDLAVSPEGCWEWNSHKPGLKTAVAEYFTARKEDGISHSPLKPGASRD